MLSKKKNVASPEGLATAPSKVDAVKAVRHHLVITDTRDEKRSFSYSCKDNKVLVRNIQDACKGLPMAKDFVYLSTQVKGQGRKSYIFSHVHFKEFASIFDYSQSDEHNALRVSVIIGGIDSSIDSSFVKGVQDSNAQFIPVLHLYDYLFKIDNFPSQKVLIGDEKIRIWIASIKTYVKARPRSYFSAHTRLGHILDLGGGSLLATEVGTWLKSATTDWPIMVLQVRERGAMAPSLATSISPAQEASSPPRQIPLSFLLEDPASEDETDESDTTYQQDSDEESESEEDDAEEEEGSEEGSEEEQESEENSEEGEESEAEESDESWSEAGGESDAAHDVVAVPDSAPASDSERDEVPEVVAPLAPPPPSVSPIVKTIKVSRPTPKDHRIPSRVVCDFLDSESEDDANTTIPVPASAANKVSEASKGPATASLSGRRRAVVDMIRTLHDQNSAKVDDIVRQHQQDERDRRMAALYSVHREVEEKLALPRGTNPGDSYHNPIDITSDTEDEITPVPKIKKEPVSFTPPASKLAALRLQDGMHDFLRITPYGPRIVAPSKPPGPDEQEEIAPTSPKAVLEKCQPAIDAFLKSSLAAPGAIASTSAPASVARSATGSIEKLRSLLYSTPNDVGDSTTPLAEEWRQPSELETRLIVTLEGDPTPIVDHMYKELPSTEQLEHLALMSPLLEILDSEVMCFIVTKETAHYTKNGTPPHVSLEEHGYTPWRAQQTVTSALGKTIQISLDIVPGEPVPKVDKGKGRAVASLPSTPLISKPQTALPPAEAPVTQPDPVVESLAAVCGMIVTPTTSPSPSEPTAGRSGSPVTAQRYLQALLESSFNTPASSALLRLMMVENVDLESALGMSLLDLALDMRTNGKLSPVAAPVPSPTLAHVEEVAEEKKTAKPTKAEYMIQEVLNKLNDHSEMLNAIAQVTGVNLLENDEHIEPDLPQMVKDVNAAKHWLQMDEGVRPLVRALAQRDMEDSSPPTQETPAKSESTQPTPAPAPKATGIPQSWSYYPPTEAKYRPLPMSRDTGHPASKPLPPMPMPAPPTDLTPAYWAGYASTLPQVAVCPPPPAPAPAPSDIRSSFDQYVAKRQQKQDHKVTLLEAELYQQRKALEMARRQVIAQELRLEEVKNRKTASPYARGYRVPESHAKAPLEMHPHLSGYYRPAAGTSEPWRMPSKPFDKIAAETASITKDGSHKGISLRGRGELRGESSSTRADVLNDRRVQHLRDLALQQHEENTEAVRRGSLERTPATPAGWL